MAVGDKGSLVLWLQEWNRRLPVKMAARLRFHHQDHEIHDRSNRPDASPKIEEALSNGSNCRDPQGID